MSDSTRPETVDTVEAFFEAYNTMDLDTFGSLLTEDVHWEHHNRFKGKGRAPLLQSIRDISATMPDRRFGKLTRWAAGDGIVYCEHQWFAVPTVTDPAWGWETGVPFQMDAASVFVFTDGLISEWSDYG